MCGSPWYKPPTFSRLLFLYANVVFKLHRHWKCIKKTDGSRCRTSKIGIAYYPAFHIRNKLPLLGKAGMLEGPPKFLTLLSLHATLSDPGNPSESHQSDSYVLASGTLKLSPTDHWSKVRPVSRYTLHCAGCAWGLYPQVCTLPGLDHKKKCRAVVKGGCGNDALWRFLFPFIFFHDIRYPGCPLRGPVVLRPRITSGWPLSCRVFQTFPLAGNA